MREDAEAASSPISSDNRPAQAQQVAQECPVNHSVGKEDKDEPGRS